MNPQGPFSPFIERGVFNGWENPLTNLGILVGAWIVASGILFFVAWLSVMIAWRAYCRIMRLFGGNRQAGHPVPGLPARPLDGAPQGPPLWVRRVLWSAVVIVTSVAPVVPLAYLCHRVYPPTRTVVLLPGEGAAGRPVTVVLKRIKVDGTVFWVSDEITEDVWRLYAGQFNHAVRSDLPVTNLTLAEMKGIANLVSERLGAGTTYKFSERDPNGVLVNKEGVRLPTAAEHVLFRRGMDTTTAAAIEAVGFVGTNSGGVWHPVGGKPRHWGREGLADLLGNLLEVGEDVDADGRPTKYTIGWMDYQSNPANAEPKVVPADAFDINHVYGFRLVLVNPAVEPDEFPWRRVRWSDFRNP